jgi:hypothetical protein
MEETMNIIVFIGSLFVAIGLTIYLMLSTIRFYGVRILFSMKYMQWMTFNEIVALGVPKLPTRIILMALVRTGSVEFRITNEHEKMIIESMGDLLEDGQMVIVRLYFRFTDMHLYEYRLLIRPRGGRKVRRQKNPGLTGVLAPA